MEFLMREVYVRLTMIRFIIHHLVIERTLGHFCELNSDTSGLVLDLVRIRFGIEEMNY